MSLVGGTGPSGTGGGVVIKSGDGSTNDGTTTVRATSTTLCVCVRQWQQHLTHSLFMAQIKDPATVTRIEVQKGGDVDITAFGATITSTGGTTSSTTKISSGAGTAGASGGITIGSGTATTAAGAVVIVAGETTGAVDGGAVSITGGTATGTSTTGSHVTVTGGEKLTNAGTAGAVSVTGGAATTSGTAGGDIVIQGGPGMCV